MKFLLTALVSLAFSPLASATVVLFDNLADLDQFNVRISYDGSGDAADYMATGGLSGSGSVQMNSGYSSQSWIAQNGFAFTPGIDYTVSAYLKVDSYAGIGFTHDPAASTGPLYPEYSVLYGISGNSQFIDLNSTGMTIDGAGGEGFWDSTGALSNNVSSPAAYATGDWIYLSLSIRFDGTDFMATYFATLSDSDGNLGDLIFDGTQDFGNSGLSSSATLYPFFYFDGEAGSPTIDTFAATMVPEPSTTALFLGAATAACTVLRRRSK